MEPSCDKRVGVSRHYEVHIQLSMDISFNQSNETKPNPEEVMEKLFKEVGTTWMVLYHWIQERNKKL